MKYGKIIKAIPAAMTGFCLRVRPNRKNENPKVPKTSPAKKVDALKFIVYFTTVGA
jgi:hypothetical protein